MKRKIASLLLSAVGLLGGGAAQAAAPVPVKVMIVSMFGPEGDVWRSHRDLSQLIPVAGLPPSDPAVHCGRDGVCQVTTGMGYANASASVAALVYSQKFDLTRTYWLIAGIAGIDPKFGTLGSAAWAHYLVDWGLQWELDPRDAPPDWPTGYLGINTRGPAETPKLDYGTEVFELNARLVQRALAVSKQVHLSDSPDAQRARARYGSAPANQPPGVIQCDTVSSDTWFAGKRLGGRVSVWVGQLTGGRGAACTSQQEDNATYAVLKRAAASGLVDTDRVAVLRAGSDFTEAPPGRSEAETLLDYQQEGGFVPALANLYLAGNPLVQNIVDQWLDWSNGVPPSL